MAIQRKRDEAKQQMAAFGVSMLMWLTANKGGQQGTVLHPSI